MSLESRLVSRLQIEGPCLVWMGAVNNRGYGQIREGERGSKLLYVHRAAFSLWVSELTKGFHVHHTCKNTSCCSPKHLIELDPRSHALTHVGTHCPRGHEYKKTGFHHSKGRRRCAECNRNQRALNYLSKKYDLHFLDT